VKRTEFKELKNLSVDDLAKKIIEVKKELADLVMDRHTSNGKGSGNLRVVFMKRKDVARMLTIVRQKQLLGEVEEKVKIQNSKVKNTNENVKVEDKVVKESNESKETKLVRPKKEVKKRATKS